MGFTALGLRRGGAARKIQFLSSSWTADNVPPSCASLLTIASKRGLIAGAGPDALVVASTDSTRKAFEHDAGVDSGIVTDFTPDITIPSSRLRHVAFSSGEDFLIASAETGGGLAIYNVLDLEKKSGPTIQISTDNVALRSLVPNPAPQFEQYVAIVTDTGNLFIADVVQGKLKEIHRDNVACVAWSAKGKAAVVGLNDGTAIQYMADGKLMGIIPRPPEIEDGYAGKF